MSTDPLSLRLLRALGNRAGENIMPVGAAPPKIRSRLRLSHDIVWRQYRLDNAGYSIPLRGKRKDKKPERRISYLECNSRIISLPF